MRFWDRVMLELKNSPNTFNSIYNIMITNFSDRQFSERVIDGVLVNQSYNDLNVSARKVANKISKIDKEKNTFIAISLDNGEFYVAAFFGILMAGFKPLLINYRLSEKEIAYVYEEAKCNYTITDSKFVPQGEILTEKDFPMATFTEEHWENEFAILSSGTTALPKILIHNGASITAQILEGEELIEKNSITTNYGKGELVILGFLPYYHIFGLITNFLMLSFFGSKFVYLQDMEPKTIQYTIRKCKVTHFFAIPLVWHGITTKVYNEVKRADKEKMFERMISISLNIQSLFPRLGSWFAKKVLFKKIVNNLLGPTPMVMITGGSEIDKKALRFFNAMGYRLYNGYGSTEIGVLTVELDKNVKNVVKGTMGRPYKSYDWKIENDVLLVKGEGLFKGTVLNGEVVYRDPNEYLDTKDIFKEENNRVTIVSRVDDVIIGDNGENLSPELIELKISKSVGVSFLCLIQQHTYSKERKLIVKFEDSVSNIKKNLALHNIFISIDSLSSNEKVSDVYIMKKEYTSFSDKVPRTKIRNMFIENETDFERVLSIDYLEVDETVIEEDLILQVINVMSVILNLEKEKINVTDDFIFDLNGTSLDYFSLVNSLSTHFDLNLSFEEIESSVTALSLSKMIKAKIEMNA